jgi:hypothetical protein
MGRFDTECNRKDERRRQNGRGPEYEAKIAGKIGGKKKPGGGAGL